MSRTDSNNRISTALDSMEQRLPTIPKKALQLNRAIARFGINLSERASSAILGSMRSVGRSTSEATSTVTGQARSAASKTMSSAASGARQVSGQAKAQSKRVVETVEDEVVEKIDSANAVVDNAADGSYETWTRAELYEKAQELDLDGRSTMSKAELIDALQQ